VILGEGRDLRSLALPQNILLWGIGHCVLLSFGVRQQSAGGGMGRLWERRSAGCGGPF
jgi:hypothetical protein